jgi:hypothetical protein
MASTLEMFMAIIALIVNTFIILVMYFVGNVTLAPIFNWAANATTSAQIVPMYDISYIPSSIFGLLLIFEVVIIISFFVVAGRRVQYDDLV